MAKIEVYLAPFPAPGAQSVDITAATWAEAMKEIVAVDANKFVHFDGRFPDIDYPTPGGIDVSHTVIGNHVGACMKEYNKRCSAAGVQRSAKSTSWVVYYRYLDAYTGYIVAHYELALQENAGTRRWDFTIEQPGVPAPRDFEFVVHAVARVQIAR